MLAVQEGFRQEWAEHNKKEYGWTVIAGFDALETLNFLLTQKEKGNCKIESKKLEQCCIPVRFAVQGRNVFLPSKREGT